MTDDFFFSKVKDRFHYLLDKYGFEILEQTRESSFDWRTLIFSKPPCQIKVVLDRGGVFVDIGQFSVREIETLSQPYWIDVGVVIAFLLPHSREEDWRRIYPLPKKQLDYNAQIDYIVTSWGDTLRRYVPQLLRFCSQGGLTKKREELEALRRTIYRSLE